MDITIDTDWGTKGAQLSGAQVQGFIKGQLRELIASDQELVKKDENLQTDINNLDQKILAQKPQLNASTDGCFVAYHRKSDNWPVAVPYWEWPELEASGEVADGVLVLVDGQTPIVVAPTDKPLPWSKNDYGVDTSVGTNHDQAYVDFAGQTRTAQIMSKSTEVFGSTEESTTSQYAAGWCYSFDRSYSYYDDKEDRNATIGVLKHFWWLPSIAELITIWKHKYAINVCLSVIKDSNPLEDKWYWSSTEATSTIVWRLNMGTGAIQGKNNKTTFQHHVRAITSFYDPGIFNDESDKENNKYHIVDDRFSIYGNCLVFNKDAEASPIAITFPFTEEKIQAAIIGSKYTNLQMQLISANYQASLAADFNDEELSQLYEQQYKELQKWQSNAAKTSKKAVFQQAVTNP